MKKCTTNGCPKYGHTFAEDCTFCTSCGKALTLGAEVTQKCTNPYCDSYGKVFSGNAIYCSSCGQAFESNSPTEMKCTNTDCNSYGKIFTGGETHCTICGEKLTPISRTKQASIRSRQNSQAQSRYQTHNQQMSPPNYQQSRQAPPNYYQNRQMPPAYPQNQHASPSYIAQNQQAFGMKWFYFIIYFQLFANAVVNAINGVLTLTGASYGGGYKTELVYAYYDTLQIADQLYALFSLGLASFAIITRFMLANYKRNAPVSLILVYLIGVLVPLFYIIYLTVIGITGLDLTGMISGMITTIVMLVANSIYFKKRESLFVN